MTADHYFSARPASKSYPQPLKITLAGRAVTVTTAAGVFSGDRLDLGTSVLLDKVAPPPSSGVFLDVGCGWGPIALTMALLSPEAEIWAVDTNERALELTALNANQLGLHNIKTALPQAVPEELRFDVIWSNPPIRIGKPELHSLLQLWLGKLTTDGEAWLVVQRNLGADSLMEWLKAEFPTRDITRAASAKGYRVLEVH